MKKVVISVVSSLLVLLCCAGFCACGNQQNEKSEDSTTTKDIGTSSSTNNTSPKESWTLDYYVDEFHEKTSAWYLTKTASGSFSNSAVTNAKLDAAFLLDKNSFSIQLYEYGNSLVNNSYSKTKYYIITAKHSNGEKVTFIGSMHPGDNRLCFDSELFGKDIPVGITKDRVFRLLSDTKISFYIEERDRITTNYLVSVDTSGLMEKYYSLVGETAPIGLRYALNNDGTSYKVVGLGSINTSNVEIPTSYNGKPVTAIEEKAFSGYTKLATVLIPGTVIDIGNHAFECCTSLTEVVISEGVQKIGDKAFDQCWLLQNVNLPGSLNLIGWACFSNSHYTINVNYGGSQIQWDQIEIKEYNDLNKASITFSDNNPDNCP